MTAFPRCVLLGVVWIVACVSAAPLVPPAQARTVYVRQSGSDENVGSSPASAVRTLGKAAMLATAGDVVLVGPGTYREGNIQPRGFVRFVADRRGTSVGDPAGDVVVDATGFATGFEFNGALAIAVDGFVVLGATIGIYVKSGSNSAVVSNNIVCNSSDNGIYVQDSPNAVVFNNLVYNNARTGILIDNSLAARVLSNTVYLNRDRGIFFRGVGSVNGLLLNNALQGNTPAGIQVNPEANGGYLSGGNISLDRFASGTPIDVTDLEADPLFVDPDGADDVLGGSGYADDDFRLSQKRAGQSVTSPAVDHGSDLSRRLDLLRASTRTDRKPDRGIVDAGYHYDNFGGPPAAPGQRLRFKKIWVSSTYGDDANDGATRETAVASLKRAFALARPGHMISIAGGVYDEGALNVRISGKPRRPVVVKGIGGARIQGRPGETALAFNSAAHIVVDGLAVNGAGQNGIEINFSQVPEPENIVLRRVRLTGNGRGLAIKSASGIHLSSSVVEGNNPRGVQVEASTLSIDRSAIRNNGDTGVWAFDGSTVTISDCDIRGNARDGVLVDRSSATVSGGSVRGSVDGGIRFRAGSTGLVENVDVIDNLGIGVQAISSVVGLIGGSIRGNRIGVQAFVDPVLQSPVEVTIEDALICENSDRGVDTQQTAVVLNEIDVCANGDDGIRQAGGTLEVNGGKVHSNGLGGIVLTEVDRVAVQRVTIGNNRGVGLQISMAGAVSVESSAVHDNTGNGLEILDSAEASVMNNLVYRNRTGILVSGRTIGSPDARVISNTVYRNANRGLLIGGSNFQPPSTNAVVSRNIFHGNMNAGIQVNTLSHIGYRGDYNLSTDPYGGNVDPGVNDIIGFDPLFVNADAGDFHLSQIAAGQSRSSPAVNSGDVSAASVGMNTKTTRTDNVADTGIVDLGYHYLP